MFDDRFSCSSTTADHDGRPCTALPVDTTELSCEAPALLNVNDFPAAGVPTLVGLNDGGACGAFDPAWKADALKDGCADVNLESKILLLVEVLLGACMGGDAAKRGLSVV